MMSKMVKNGLKEKRLKNVRKIFTILLLQPFILAAYSMCTNLHKTGKHNS